MKVRFHRGGLAESMATMFEPKDWQDFCEHCKEESEFILTDSIKCEHYCGADDRIGWKDTWIITAKYNYEADSYDYPIGFSDEDIMKLSEE